LSVLALALCVTSSEAATLCVNIGGTSGCFATVQDALTAAAADPQPDTITVAAGIFPQFNVPDGSKVTISGAGPGATIFDGAGGVVLLGAKSQVSISGATVRLSSAPGFFSYGVQGLAGSRFSVADADIVNATGSLAGGGIGGGKNVVRRCRIHGWASGVGAGSGSRMKIEDSTIDGNYYGVVVAGSTARQGGTVEIARSTISGNSATCAMCGAVQVGDPFAGSSTGQGMLKLTQSTVAANLGPGVMVANGARLSLEDDLIGDNPVGADCLVEPLAKVSSRGFNLLESNGCIPAAKIAPTDVIGFDPMIAGLANNGGSTPTHALLPGSPAIGRVTNPGLCKKPDQRGQARSVPCDIGAFELP
jgi:hypothetical protein